MAEPFIGEIKLVPYNYAPRGWAFCAGQLLPIAQNEALFSLVGTMYGGDGQVTFALPDLRGRVVINQGQAPGLTSHDQGEVGGNERIILGVAQVPAHSHTARASSLIGNQPTPAGKHIAKSPLGLGNVFAAPGGDVMPGAIKPAGGAQPHENRQPYLVLNYVIALEGVYPPRN